MNGLVVRGDGGGQISRGTQADPQIIVSIRVRAITSQRLFEGMDGSGVLSVGIKSQAEELVSLRVLRVHAEGGAGLRDRIWTIIQAIENVGQAAVILGEIRHELGRQSDLVIGVVPSLLPNEHAAKCEVQRGVLRVSKCGRAEIEFGFVEPLRFGIGGGLQQRRGYFRSSRSGRFQTGQGAKQIPISTSGFELMNLILAWDACDTTLLNYAN